MGSAIHRQKTVRLVQTVLLMGGMVILAARAAALVVGPFFGWLLVLVAPVVTVYSLAGQRLLLPPGTRQLQAAEAPEVHRILRDLVFRAGLDFVPPIFVLPSGTAEAMTTGIGGGARILVSRGLLRRLSPREIAGVLAHEISHIRNRDLPLFAMAGAMQRITRVIGLFLTILVLLFFPLLLAGVPVIPLQALLYMAVVPLVTVFVQFALLRTREFQADLGAVELTGDPAGLASALAKLESVRRPLWNFMIVTGGRRSVLGELLRTHPGTEERIRRLGELQSFD
ncbi:MAG: hypothetical protein EA427_00850 [Spirochaetaceae bacterium]|nr:MAG: hypothetical protein EA427_00850 [Spirochaetaceae bacterium]